MAIARLPSPSLPLSSQLSYIHRKPSLTLPTSLLSVLRHKKLGRFGAAAETHRECCALLGSLRCPIVDAVFALLACIPVFAVGPPQPPVLLDLSDQTDRQVIVDREPGQYLAWGWRRIYLDSRWRRICWLSR